MVMGSWGGRYSGLRLNKIISLPPFFIAAGIQVILSIIQTFFQHYLIMKRLFYFLLILVTSSLKAQQTPAHTDNSKIQGIVAALDSFNSKIPLEKVHLHFDKPYYRMGDTI